MTTINTARILAPLITCRNLGGALVTVTDMGTVPTGPGASHVRYAARCHGCLENGGTDASPMTIRDARDWAGRHAGACRAMPQGAPAADSWRGEYAALAAQYAARAAGLLGDETKPLDGGRRSEVEKQDPTAAARIYVTIADVYARLASGTGVAQ